MSTATVEMSEQMFNMLQEIMKRMDTQDKQIETIHELVLKKHTRKRGQPLAPYSEGLSAISDICSAEIKETDQKVFLGFVCKREDETKVTKIPVFSFTVNIFREFMEIYNAASDGDKVSVPDEAKFTRRYAEALMDSFTMPENLK